MKTDSLTFDPFRLLKHVSIFHWALQLLRLICRHARSLATNMYAYSSGPFSWSIQGYEWHQ